MSDAQALLDLLDHILNLYDASDADKLELIRRIVAIERTRS